MADADHNPDILHRLRNTPNWLRESYGHWKDCTREYDRAPFEAADEIEALRECLREVWRSEDKDEWVPDFVRRVDALLGEGAKEDQRG